MAAKLALTLKIINPEGEHVASCAQGEEAACLMAFLGDGAKIKFGTITVWHEGSEAIPAGESYDIVTDTIVQRIEAHPDLPRIAREVYEQAEKQQS